MFKNLFEYFLKPLLKVTTSTIFSLVKFDLVELKTNIFFRLPLIFSVGFLPFLNKFWLKWYIQFDIISMNVFGVFNPASTVQRILGNVFCPSVVVNLYDDYINSEQFKVKRFKFMQD